MTLSRLIISTALAVMSLANTAQSQDLMGFDRASFGSVVLPQTQSAIGDIQLELAIGDYKNEPIVKYSDRANFVKIGKSVGRLDVLTDKGNFPCTAFIVSSKYILTNYHCSLGILDNEKIGATRIDGTQFVAGYTRTGFEEGTRKYFVVPTPVEVNKALDYAVLEVIGDPSEEYGELKLASLVPEEGDPFWIIGHPMGEGQRISREDCRAGSPAISKNTLLHTCDTYFGNSGSPVIDTTSQQVIALHHAGSLKDNVNYAILMSKILKSSKVLAAYKTPEDVPKSQPEEPKIAAKSACDALYSAAAEAKACYAYEAYINSCQDHSLAPIADGYIKKFCQVQEVVQVEEAPETTVVKKTCNDKPEVCSDDGLCEAATFITVDSRAWKSSQVYVKEAKKRGLNCGVKAKTTASSDFKGEYKSHSPLYRKQIQYALKKLGFYSSSIDGLWGKGTRSAIVDYVQANGLGGSSPNGVFRSVVIKVDVPISFENAPAQKTTKAATVHSRGWYQKYGFSCSRGTGMVGDVIMNLNSGKSLLEFTIQYRSEGQLSGGIADVDNTVAKLFLGATQSGSPKKLQLKRSTDGKVSSFSFWLFGAGTCVGNNY